MQLTQLWKICGNWTKIGTWFKLGTAARTILGCAIINLKNAIWSIGALAKNRVKFCLRLRDHKSTSNSTQKWMKNLFNSLRTSPNNSVKTRIDTNTGWRDNIQIEPNTSHNLTRTEYANFDTLAKPEAFQNLKLNSIQNSTGIVDQFIVLNRSQSKDKYEQTTIELLDTTAILRLTQDWGPTFKLGPNYIWVFQLEIEIYSTRVESVQQGFHLGQLQQIH